MMLTYSFDLLEEAQAIEDAVARVYEEGHFTADLTKDGALSTKEWTAKVVEQLSK